MKKTSIFAILWLLSFVMAHGQVTPSGRTETEVETMVEESLAKLTLDEKITLIGGSENGFYTQPMPSIGLRSLHFADGPQGLGIGKNGPSTAYPATVLLAATWNTEMGYDYGHALGADARQRGLDVLLGPAVNIYRAPFCGRNFEYMGEDPFLVSRISSEYIKGVQDNGILATIKHFFGNNSDYDRHHISNDIDLRTLHEIYFPAFRAAVQDAGVAAVMSSYNLYDGIYTSEHPQFMHKVLREDWGFKGLLMSDWCSVHHTIPAVRDGVDLEMPYGEYMNAEEIKYHIRTGDLTEDMIDFKVRHFLYTIYAYGMDLPKDVEVKTTEIASSAQTALNVAREGIVLLKNEKNILPLKKKRVALIGQNAVGYRCGGGSGESYPINHVDVATGMKEIGAEHNSDVHFIDMKKMGLSDFYTHSGSDVKGLRAEYFTNPELKGEPAFVETDAVLDHVWDSEMHIEGMPREQFSARYTGVLRPAQTGEYVITVGGDDGYRMFFEDDVVENWAPNAFNTKELKKHLIAGQEYSVTVEYFQHGGGAGFMLNSTRADRLSDAVTIEMDASDAIVVCVGFNKETEHEGSDRPFELCLSDRILLDVAVNTGKPVIAIIYSGGSVDLEPWVEDLSAILWAGYPGQAAGTALAEIIYGDVNPSGHLPMTFEKRWEDNPSYDSYHDLDGDSHVEYKEGVFTGYRGYQKNGVQPRYPFGYGLSYSRFALGKATAHVEADGTVKVTCTLTNKGRRAGAQVVQAYVGPVGEQECIVERPALQLKAFDKVFLSPGESAIVTFDLPVEAFAYFDEEKYGWEVPAGEYRIALGFSSEELPLNVIVKL